MRFQTATEIGREFKLRGFKKSLSPGVRRENDKSSDPLQRVDIDFH